MTTTTVTYTPWGWTRDIEELAEGVSGGSRRRATAG